MAGVVMPQQKQKDQGLGKVLQVGGAVVGGIYGGPAGAMAGASAGSQLGGLAAKAPPAPMQAVESGGASAMARRASSLQPIQPDDYGPQLANAEQAAAQLPPDLQQQYLPAIVAARQRSQGVV
ncbi:MAG: hypothetical protein V4750_02760 [Pseudomonadota bacterium]